MCDFIIPFKCLNSTFFIYRCIRFRCKPFLSICKLRLLDIFVITKSICFRYAQTRYDINLVAIATYRVACNISSLLRHIENLARDLYRCVAYATQLRGIRFRCSKLLRGVYVKLEKSNRQSPCKRQ